MIALTSTLSPPKFHNLNKNPGLLPLRLGNAQITTNYWTFVQIYDITDIINEYTTLKDAFIKIKTKLHNSTHHDNNYQIIKILEEKVKFQIKQLNPQYTKRVKRGLIDGLGSIIKSITGNLDQRDAEKFDTVISKLQNDQNKIKTLLKEQITILENSVKSYNSNLEIISKNQIVLSSKIEKLEKHINNTYSKTMEAADCQFVQTVLMQYTSSLQIIYDLLEKIEVAITFSKLNTFHNSIIDPNDLLSEILLIKEHLNKNKFPFEPKLENLLLFEKIINIKSYTKGNKITFLLEIPIVEIESFNYYHLYSLPTLVDSSFKTIIPRSKYLLYNEQTYAFLNEDCKEITTEEFLCYEVQTSKINYNIPCEIQLLKYIANSTTCKIVPINLPNVKIQKIRRNQWIVIAPNSVIAKQMCGKVTDNIFLNGTYLVELDSDCEVHIQDTILKTYQNYKINFKNIELPNLQLDNQLNHDDFVKIENVELDSVNLDETKNIISVINSHKKNLKELDDQPIVNFNISVFTIFLYFVIILSIISYLTCRFYVKRKSLSDSKSNEESRMSPNSVGKTPIVLN